MFTKQEVVDEVVEKILLMLPEIMGNLITNHMSKLKLNKDFYLSHPEFRDKKDIVTSVIEMVEGLDPTVDYKDILYEAIPEIKKRISQVKGLDFESLPEPDRSFHGEL
jgi:predicted nucleic-acid-binding protein